MGVFTLVDQVISSGDLAKRSAASSQSRLVLTAGLVVGLLGFGTVWYSEQNPGVVQLPILLSVVIVLLGVGFWMKIRLVKLRNQQRGS